MTRKSSVEEKELKKQIGSGIFSALKEKNMTQIQLSKLTGIAPTTISSYMRGINIPSFVNMQKINETLGISIDLKIRTQLVTKENLDIIINANKEIIENFLNTNGLSFEKQKERAMILINNIEDDVNAICTLKNYFDDFIEERLYWYFEIKMESIKINFMKLLNDEFGMKNIQHVNVDMRQKIIERYSLEEFGVFY